MVDYGYKNQRETLKTYEDLYFGSCLVWEKNELFFKGNNKYYNVFNLLCTLTCSVKYCNKKNIIHEKFIGRSV